MFCDPIEGVTLRTALLDHPDGTNGYRLEYGGRVFALISDTSGFPGKRDRELVQLARGADLIVYDATYTEEEIATRSLGPFDLESRHPPRRRGRRKHLCLVPP